MAGRTSCRPLALGVRWRLPRDPLVSIVIPTARGDGATGNLDARRVQKIREVLTYGTTRSSSSTTASDHGGGGARPPPPCDATRGEARSPLRRSPCSCRRRWPTLGPRSRDGASATEGEWRGTPQRWPDGALRAASR